MASTSSIQGMRSRFAFVEEYPSSLSSLAAFQTVDLKLLKSLIKYCTKLYEDIDAEVPNDLGSLVLCYKMSCGT